MSAISFSAGEVFCLEASAVRLLTARARWDRNLGGARAYSCFAFLSSLITDHASSRVRCIVPSGSITDRSSFLRTWRWTSTGIHTSPRVSAVISERSGTIGEWEAAGKHATRWFETMYDWFETSNIQWLRK